MTVGFVRLAIVALGLASTAAAEPIAWTDWTAATATEAKGTVLGIAVTYSGNLWPPAIIDGGPSLWARNPETYRSRSIDNGPDRPDIIRLYGGSQTGVQTLTFSRPVTEPVMAIMSLGQAGHAAQFNFDRDFVIENSGPGPWGPGVLERREGNILTGREGQGVIRFRGTLRSITWINPVAEGWYGFQIGLPERNKGGIDGTPRDRETNPPLRERRSRPVDPPPPIILP